MSSRSSRVAVVVLLVVLAALLAPGAAGAAPAKPIYLDPSYSFRERAADLVSRMTLAEKASQMNSSRAPAIPRLGVATYGWWNEALHGVSREQLEPAGNATTLTNTTSYPISLSLGASWDPGLVYREARAISDEAREVVRDNRFDLDFYSPTVNLGRDPRWGRNDETFSEDPFLTAALAGQFVDGMEGKDQRGRLLPQGHGYLKTITTLKHFAANNSEVNRRTGSSDMDERTLREYYTDQFRRIIRQSHPGSIMSSYNSVNGVPAAANVHLMDTLARKSWGFGGYFTSDCDAIYEIVAGHHWQPPGWSRPLDDVERHAFALTAGEDLDCNAGYHDAFNYGNTLPAAVARHITTQTGTLTENDLDTALVRLFTARMRLGEFDPPGQVPWVRAARARLPRGSWVNSDANHAVTETRQRLALSREVGAKSIVLLKNKARGGAPALPLRVPRTGPFKVAVIGYLANPQSLYLGGYSSDQGPAGAAKEVTPYAGIRDAVHAVNPQATVTFTNGFRQTGTAEDLTAVDPAAIAAARGADAAVVYVGTDAGTAGEDQDRSTLALPGAQAALAREVGQANPHTVVAMETIGAVDVTPFAGDVSAILWSSYNGQVKGRSLADVLLGRYNPSARLPFTWYRGVGQLPPITDYAIRPAAGRPGRTYMYFRGAPTYPFGYGLSYTRFHYSRLRVDRSHLRPGDRLRVSVDVTNTGSVRGSDAVELYASTPDAPAAAQRPSRRLRGLAQVSLAPGQTKTEQFTVAARDLAFFDEGRGRYVVDPGRYTIAVGASAGSPEVQRDVHVAGRQRAVPSVVTVQPTMAGDAGRGIPTRVLFPRGARVVAHLTVALTDERLFGYVTRGAGRPLPPGMTVRYASDRPGVVAVGRRGAIRAVGDGVATLTARVRYRGVTRAGSAVVHVGAG